MLRINLKQLINFSEKRNFKIVGNINTNLWLNNVAPINSALKNEIAFCRFEGLEGIELIKSSKSSFIFISISLFKSEIFNHELMGSGKVFAVCDSPRLEIAYFLREYWKEEIEDARYIKNSSGGLVHLDAIISPSAEVMHGAIVGKNVTLGANSVVFPGAVINNAIIGDQCKVGSNAVIGGVGFGFESDPVTGEQIDFPHIGIVRIGNNVRIGACTCIDRGSVGETIISNGVKIDNLVHIAHNVKIGHDSKIVALSIIGGSAQIGDNCWLAPASVIRDWIKLGNDSIIGMGAVVTKSVQNGATVVGNPAKEITPVKRKYL